MFLKGRASGKPAPAIVDVSDVVCAILDVKDKKRSQSSLVLACKAWSVEAVMEVLLTQGEHKAKQKAVPALEMVKALVGTVGVLGPKNQAAMLKTAASAAQMSDPAIRRAALEVLAAMHAHMGDALLDTCAGLMRPPILASLREMVVKAGTPSKENAAARAGPAATTGIPHPPAAAAAAAASVPVSVASTPIRARPPSQLPAPVIVQSQNSHGHSQSMIAQPPPAASAVAVVAAPPSSASASSHIPVFSVEHAQTAPAASAAAAGGRNPLEEWTRMSGWVESQLRAMQAEKQKADALLRRCHTLEGENEELLLMAKELEREAAKQGPSFEAIQSMSIDELNAAEAVHQDALAAIAQRKKMLVEEMARKSECLACSRPRAKSTVLFPCRHVVCSGCGVAIKNCPDCSAVVAQRFELPENVHV